MAKQEAGPEERARPGARQELWGRCAPSYAGHQVFPLPEQLCPSLAVSCQFLPQISLHLKGLRESFRPPTQQGPPPSRPLPISVSH